MEIQSETNVILITQERLQNFPTEERKKHGDIRLTGEARGKIVASAKDPLRIDKLLRLGTIDENHHFYGKQLLTLWYISGRPHLRAMKYENTGRGTAPELAALARLEATEQYFAIARKMSNLSWNLVYAITILEQGVYEAAKNAKIYRQKATKTVIAAFDELGDIIYEVRKIN